MCGRYSFYASHIATFSLNEFYLDALDEKG